jgi:WD40 repeat protein
LAISPDNSTLAAGEYAVYLHQLADGFLLDAYTTRTGPRSVAYSPDGDVLGAGLALHGTSLIDTGTSEQVGVVGDGFDNSLAFSPDGGLVAVGNRDGIVTVLEATDLEVLTTLAADGAEAVTSLSFDPTGDLLAVTYLDCLVRVWDATTTSVVHELQLDTGDGSCGLSAAAFAFTPDGAWMVGAVRDAGTQLLRIWAHDDARVEAEFEVADRVRDLAFSPDGGLLALAANAETQIIDVEQRAVRHVVTETAAAGLIPRPASTAFGHDGGHVAGRIDWDGTVELWRLPGAEELVAPERAACDPVPLPGDVLFDTGSSELRARRRRRADHAGRVGWPTASPRPR